MPGLSGPLPSTRGSKRPKRDIDLATWIRNAALACAVHRHSFIRIRPAQEDPTVLVAHIFNHRQEPVDDGSIRQVALPRREDFADALRRVSGHRLTNGRDYKDRPTDCGSYEFEIADLTVSVFMQLGRNTDVFRLDLRMQYRQ